MYRCYNKKLIYAIGVVSCFLIGRIYAQTTVDIAPSKDNTLFESTTGSVSNGAGQHFFVGTTNQGNTRRGVIAFDVAAEIPQGATVQSVTLTLNLSNTNFATGPQPIGLHPLLADWGEGSSNATGAEGQGAPSTTGDATWIHRFFDTSTWTTPGGDFSPTASATMTVDNVGFYTWGSTAGMVADVQNWVDNPAQNFGWILVGGNESTNQTAKRFDTKEHPTLGNRPVLTVTFDDPTSVSEGGDNLPTEFHLAQNYPNPFNPTTVIAYSIPQSVTPVKVTLEIFNLLGQKVQTLVNSEHPAGTYSVQWHATDARGNLLPAGVYMYRLQAGADFVDLKKMVLVK